MLILVLIPEILLGWFIPVAGFVVGGLSVAGALTLVVTNTQNEPSLVAWSSRLFWSGAASLISAVVRTMSS